MDKKVIRAIFVLTALKSSQNDKTLPNLVTLKPSKMVVISVTQIVEVSFSLKMIKVGKTTTKFDQICPVFLNFQDFIMFSFQNDIRFIVTN